MRPLTVLVTAAGAPGTAALLRALRRNGEREIRLVGCDMNELAVGRFLCDSFHVVPAGADAGFAGAVRSLCEREGVDAVLPQSSHDLGGLNLAELRARGLVPATLVDKSVPDDDTTARDAVGWLHANCGHCHNQNGVSWPDTDMTLRFGYGEISVASSKVYLSTVGVATRSYRGAGFDARIEPGNADEKAKNAAEQERSARHLNGDEGTVHELGPALPNGSEV